MCLVENINTSPEYALVKLHISIKEIKKFKAASEIVLIVSSWGSHKENGELLALPFIILSL